jgi:hypothetical protein
VNVQEGLIHLWALDETGGTIATDSVGGWHLETVGGATLGASGVQGRAVLLDGTDDFLRSAAGTTSFLTSDFTVSFWAKLGSYAGKPGLLQFRNGTKMDFVLTLDYRAPVVTLFANTGTARASGVAPLEDHAWHLFTAVRQGSDAAIYVDDALIASGSGTLASTGANVFTLGLDDATHFFGGSIDDVAIYNRALSPVEIAANVVPEPAAMSLLAGAGAVAVACRRRRPQACPGGRVIFSENRKARGRCSR